MRAPWIAILLAGCVPDEPSSHVLGAPADVTTAAGDYSGYRIVAPCAGTWVNLSVTGTGAIVLTDVDAIAAAGAELRTAIADFTAVWSAGGYGLACEPGIGTQIDLDDWREVDPLIARVGAWLRERDLALQVGISVGSIPVPH